MIGDPMANIDHGTEQDGSGNPTSSTMGTGGGTREVVDGMALQQNLMRIDRIRAVMGIASGCVVGIAGVSGLQGFVWFVLFHIFVSSIILAMKMNFDLKSYTRQSWQKYYTTAIYPTALSFTLFWTLFYGLVYLY